MSRSQLDRPSIRWQRLPPDNALHCLGASGSPPEWFPALCGQPIADPAYKGVGISHPPAERVELVQGNRGTMGRVRFPGVLHWPMFDGRRHTTFLDLPGRLVSPANGGNQGNYGNTVRNFRVWIDFAQIADIATSRALYRR
jgi:hypothetical protein